MYEHETMLEAEEQTGKIAIHGIPVWDPTSQTNGFVVDFTDGTSLFISVEASI